MPLVIACASVTNDSALCTGLTPSVDALVDVVVKEGTDAIVLATEELVVDFDAGCDLGL